MTRPLDVDAKDIPFHAVFFFFQSPIENYCIPIKSLQNWFKPEDAKNKRSIIRDVIENLRVLQS